jgi:glycosyltransferase involved in cell wall biosynthesis
MATLSFVTVSMGRLAFLQQTLRQMAAQPECRTIVVDYSCPDGTADWVEANYPQVGVVRMPGHSTFHLSVARNAGARSADTQWVCFIDADITLASDFAETVLPTLQPGHFYRADPGDAGTWGTFICSRDDLNRTGGYDETYQNWGDEDDDLYDALRFFGITPATFPARLIHHIPHDDGLRVQFHTIKDRNLGHTINRVYRAIKWDMTRLSGKLLSQDKRDRLYEAVTQKVTEVSRSNAASELKIDMGSTMVPTGWKLSRGLSYSFSIK